MTTYFTSQNLNHKEMTKTWGNIISDKKKQTNKQKKKKKKKKKNADLH